ncbi:hypothetical protein HU200_030666 [Digitaria exilis]|uniref:RING-type domain-containing protein n=1 Tax=Digitaria exilis TaxID=1010633 RepID=A0A835EN43_9POAL|nr:hypothetical protein HU200_030666 [Digitaria exilis]CAB3459203.1 unnamed protein product [Digitaria exilis]
MQQQQAAGGEQYAYVTTLGPGGFSEMRRVPACSIRSINLPVPPELIFNPDLDAAADRLFEEVDRSRSSKRARAAATTEAIEGLVQVPGASRSGEDCPVCLHTFSAEETLRAMPCSHAFHHQCISQWLRRNAICPLCRHPLLVMPDDDDKEEELHQNQRRRTTTT